MTAHAATTPQSVKKAMLLAAGRGTRMRELTSDIPKPMIPVRGKPILQTIIEGLRDAGVEEFLVIVGYRKEIVMNHFGDGSAFGVRITYAIQETQDGTGRVINLGREFVGGDPFILSYGDILTDPVNYLRLATIHPHEEALLSVKHSEDVSKGGAVFVNEHFEVIDLREKPKPGEPTSPWYNAGIYTFRPSIFEHAERLTPSPRGEYELTDAIRSQAIETQSTRETRVQAFQLTGEWADVRDPEILANLNNLP